MSILGGNLGLGISKARFVQVLKSLDKGTHAVMPSQEEKYAG